jgi:hypothetical protein
VVKEGAGAAIGGMKRMDLLIQFDLIQFNLFYFILFYFILFYFILKFLCVRQSL